MTVPGIIPIIKVSGAAGKSPDGSAFGAAVFVVASVKRGGRTYYIANQTVVKLEKRQPAHAHRIGRGSINIDGAFGPPIARRGTRRGAEVTARSGELPARVREIGSGELARLQVGDRGVPATEQPHSPERRSRRSDDIDNTSDASRGNQPGENEIRDGVPHLRTRTGRQWRVRWEFKCDSMSGFPKLSFTAGRLR